MRPKDPGKTARMRRELREELKGKKTVVTIYIILRVLVILTMVFNSVGLPVEAIGLIMGIDRILDMTRTAVNITGDAVCTTIVAHQNKALDKSVFERS